MFLCIRWCYNFIAAWLDCVVNNYAENILPVFSNDKGIDFPFPDWKGYAFLIKLEFNAYALKSVKQFYAISVWSFFLIKLRVNSIFCLCKIANFFWFCPLHLKSQLFILHFLNTQTFIPESNSVKLLVIGQFHGYLCSKWGKICVPWLVCLLERSQSNCVLRGKNLSI